MSAPITPGDPVRIVPGERVLSSELLGVHAEVLDVGPEMALVLPLTGRRVPVWIPHDELMPDFLGEGISMDHGEAN